MALFQSAVLNNYLNSVEDTQVEDAWIRFTDHFHNPEIQDNIRNSKEEEYQDGFLSDLFVNVLGYSKYPAHGYNLKGKQAYKEIDQMVQKLYGAFKEKIEVLEGVDE